MAKMSDFSNHNIFAYMLASCANLNFHPVVSYDVRFFSEINVKYQLFHRATVLKEY